MAANAAEARGNPVKNLSIESGPDFDFVKSMFHDSSFAYV